MDQDCAVGTEQDLKMVTLNEFANLMSVCPNTVRAWIVSGELSEDRHYIRIGRVIRFPWSSQLVKNIMEYRAAGNKARRKTVSNNGNRGVLRYKA